MVKSLRVFACVISSVCICDVARADTRSEDYIQSAVYQLMNKGDKEQPEAWQRKFRNSIKDLVDFDLMARFSLGRYARPLSQVEFEKYKSVFSEYSLVTFEHYFEKYGNFSIVIKDSIDRNEQDSVVSTRVTMGNGKEVDLKWRVLSRNGAYKVVDIALEIDGSQLWLAIEQRSQFLAILERKNGSVDELIQVLEEKMHELQE